MTMLLFLSVMAVLICVAALVVAVLLGRKPREKDEADERRRGRWSR